MLRMFLASIVVILKVDGVLKKLTHGLTWAAMAVIILGVIAILI